jgi:hypothetical protein
MDENEKSSRSLWKEKRRIEARLKIINERLGIEDETEALERELEAAQKLIDRLQYDVPVRTAAAAAGVDIVTTQRDTLSDTISAVYNRARKRYSKFHDQYREQDRNLAKALVRTHRQPPIVLKMIAITLAAKKRLLKEVAIQTEVDTVDIIALHPRQVDPVERLRNAQNLEFWAALEGLSTEFLKSAVYLANDIHELVAESFAEMKVAKDHRPRIETLKLIGKEFLQKEVTKEPASFEKIQKYLGYGYIRRYIYPNQSDLEFYSKTCPELGDPRELRRCNDYLRRFVEWLLPVAIGGEGLIDDIELEPNEFAIIGIDDRHIMVDYDDLERLRADRK